MADKNFKVKSGLQVPSVTSANLLVTDSSGIVSAGTTLPIASGGTGQTTSTNAINALLPVQNGSTVNYTIQSDGTNVSWAKVYNQLIQNGGVSVTPRRILNIVGGTFSDDSETDITTITLGSASVSVSSNITLVAGTKYFVDTTSARTLTLPASPSLGDEIVIYDAANNALTNNITVASNSNKIQGSVQDLIIDSNAAVAYLAYTGSTYGWAVN
jgi:hypothetical protein